MGQDNDTTPPVGSSGPVGESQTRIEPALDNVWATRVPGRETDEPPAAPTDQFATRVGGADTTMIPVPSQPDWPTVPGYEILGELGRGGMGVVYKARQLNLHRFVALKMIRTGPSASPEEVQRFRTEAETIARLQHPNIVQLFEFMEQKGEAFLALELIEGSALNKNIAAPWPPQQAARLLETLARAMHYAHEQGIIHRDLKPANILLNKVKSDTVGDGIVSTVSGNGGTLPRKGGATVHRLPFLARYSAASTYDAGVVSFQPKITDFGLAKLMSADSAGPTVTGDFLGTPTYSAPEQASGKIHEMGPHTDVYALGVILYELLTGRPPFQGATVLDTLDQVRSQEPVPPSRLQKRVPRDLETICLKCLQKSPQRRYPSALLLAEDLQAYLHGRPILARPVSVVERTLKLAKRHPGWTACISLGVVALGGLVVGLFLWAAASSAAAKLESKLRKETEVEREEARANFADAVDVVERMMSEIAGVDLEDVPQLEPVRKKVLLGAQNFFKKFLRKRSDDPELRLFAGRARRRLGDIHELLDEHAAAEHSYVEARELLAETAKSSKQEAELARVCNELGVLFKRLGRYPKAQKSLEQARDLRQKVLEESPKREQAVCLQDLAQTWYYIGTVLARVPEQREKAEKAYKEALHIQEDLCKSQPDEVGFERDRARTLNNLGILLQYSKPKEAEARFREAVKTHSKMAQGHPNVPLFRRLLAWSHSNLASVRGVEGGEAEYGQALKLLKQLAVDFPTVPIYRQESATVYYNLGLLYHGARRFGKADKAFGDALAIRQQLAHESAGDPDYQDKLANVHVDVGRCLQQRGSPLEAEKHYLQGVSLLEKIAVPGGHPLYQHHLAQALGYEGKLLVSRSDRLRLILGTEVVLQSANGIPWCLGALPQGQEALLQARDCFSRAVSHQLVACEADKKNADFSNLLYAHYRNLFFIQVRLTDHEGLAESAQAFQKMFRDLKASYGLAAQRLAQAVVLVDADVRLTLEQRRQAGERYGLAAIQILRAGLSRGFLNVNELKTSPIYAPLRHRADFQAIIRAQEDLTPRNA